MKLYRITATRDAEVKEVVWTGSQTESAKTRKELMGKEFKRAEIDTQEIDVPTNKDGLLAFLNERSA